MKKAKPTAVKKSVARKTKPTVRKTELIVANPMTSARKLEPSFLEVVNLIQQARQRAFQVVNTTLIDLYWQIGEYISGQVESQSWGKAVIQQLSEYLKRTQPDLHGFSAPNLWRMKQFFETYHAEPKLSALLRELPWTHNLMILGKSKRSEEREFTCDWRCKSDGPVANWNVKSTGHFLSA